MSGSELVVAKSASFRPAYAEHPFRSLAPPLPTKAEDRFCGAPLGRKGDLSPPTPQNAHQGQKDMSLLVISLRSGLSHYN